MASTEQELHRAARLLQHFIAFAESPEIQASIDGANDPDILMEQARAFVERHAPTASPDDAFALSA